MNNIIAYMRKIVNKCFKTMKITKCFSNKYGIKFYNKPRFNYSNIKAKNIEEVLPEELYLGFDGLKDDYTLLENKIIDSPHYSLIYDAIKTENNLNNNIYLLLENKGSLDGRFELIVNKKTKKEHINSCLNTYIKVKNNKYEPIYIYKLNGKKYIFDGKHRAAICCLLDKKIKCIDIGTKIFQDDIYTKKLLYFMNRKNYREYEKNINFLKLLMNEKR